MIGMMEAKNRARNAAREIASESLWGPGCARKKGRKSGHCTNTRIAEKVSWGQISRLPWLGIAMLARALFHCFAIQHDHA